VTTGEVNCRGLGEVSLATLQWCEIRVKVLQAIFVRRVCICVVL
jgi:hypothetical protein